MTEPYFKILYVKIRFFLPFHIGETSQFTAASLSEAGHLLPVGQYQVNNSAKVGLLSPFCWIYSSLLSSPQKEETYHPPCLSIKLFPTMQSLVAPT